MRRIFFVVFVINCFFSIEFSVAQSIDPNNITKLTSFGVDYLEDRMPLIVIHGIWGTDKINDDQFEYWSNFLTYFYGASPNAISLRENFKLYFYFYESDKVPVYEIADSLAYWIDQKTAQAVGRDSQWASTPIVILAHSMGGLVARSFMDRSSFSEGIWAGKKGGERVINVVTLGTPHHGTPAANYAGSRNGVDGCLRSELRFVPVPNLAPLCRSFSLVDHIECVQKYFRFNGVSTVNSNRNDLLWDNYNNSMDSCAEIDGLERNRLLSNFLTNEYDYKIIAYGGSISDPGYFINSDVKIKYSVMWDILFTFMKNPEDYGYNDGAVPISSSLFDGGDISNRRTFDQFDHEKIRGQNLDYLSDDYNNFFSALSNDLNSMGINFGIPVKPYAPADVRFIPFGDFSENTVFTWEFHDETIKTDRFVSFLYKKNGEYSVKMIATDPVLGTQVIRRKDIFVHRPRIDVIHNSTNPLRKTFKVHSTTPEFVQEYRWKFGDNGLNWSIGDNEEPHFYSEPEFYYVDVELILDEYDSVYGSTSVYAGSGTQYIGQHTIYGDVTWSSDVDYVVEGNVSIEKGGSLTIEPGTLVKLTSNVEIRVRGSLSVNDAILTADDSQQPWSGIY